MSAVHCEAGAHHIADIGAYYLLCTLRDRGIAVAPTGDRLAVSARGPFPEGVRARLRAEKVPLLRLLTQATTIAEAQTLEIIARRVEAGMDLLRDMELAGQSEKPEYTRHLAMFLTVLCALDVCTRVGDSTRGSEIAFREAGSL